jgi:hypothetical protein
MRGTRIGLCVAACVAALIGSAIPAGAVPPEREPGGSVGFGEIPAGIACEFAVSIDLVSGGQGQRVAFFDRAGNLVRETDHARPSTFLFTNLDTGKSVALRLPGGTLTITPLADGTTKIVINGSAIGFNAPTDTPPGPFSFTSNGHLVLVVASDGNSTITQLSGNPTDLCAAVA